MEAVLRHSFPDMRVEITPQAVWLTAHEPLQALSSAVLGGGFSTLRSLFILHVDKDYNNDDPRRHLETVADQKGLPLPTIGMLTAAALERTGFAEANRDGLSVAVVVTAGVSNATSAGITPPASLVPPGTINIVVLVDGEMTPSAMVNAVITITEAKSDCLRRMGIRINNGEPATGTSTDAVVIAQSGHGKKIPYAGPAILPAGLWHRRCAGR